MATKMNSKTRKVIWCEYRAYQAFAVPIDWVAEDCSVKYDTLIHTPTGTEVEGVLDSESDYKYPHDQREEDIEDHSGIFELDDSDDEDDDKDE